MSESKTRSGKIFQSKMVNGNNQQGQTSKENWKRGLRQFGKTVLHVLESSQESVLKKRRVSEPKEHT